MTELPPGWSLAKMEDVADIQLGKMLDKQKNRGEPTPYLRNVNVRWGAFNLTQIATMLMSAEEREALRIRDGDVLVCEGGEPGRAAVWAGGPSSPAFQKALMRMRPRLGVEPAYLAHYLKDAAVRGVLAEGFTGTTIKHLPQNALRASRIPVAPSPEQRRIVAKLNALIARTASVRADLDRIPTLAARYKQAVLGAAFRGDLTADVRAATDDLSNSSKPEQEWALPRSWRWRRMHEVGEVRLGRQRSPINHRGPNMRPYLRAANITWNGLDLSDVNEMNFDETDFRQFGLVDGDVLINEGSGSAHEVGKPAIWRGEIEGCCFQNTLLSVRPKKCGSEYLCYYLLFSARSRRFVKETQGVNIFHIGKAGLSAFPMPIAPPAEQVKVVERLELALTEIDRLAGEAAAARLLLDRLDQSILAKAFRGELIPQDPTDEPAAALLDRIRAERAGDAANPKRDRRRAPA